MARPASLVSVPHCPIEREVAALIERQHGHETRDDDRFGNLLLGQSRIEDSVDKLVEKVDALVEDVGAIKVTVAGLTAMPAPGPPPPPGDGGDGHWRIGPGAWAVVAMVAGAAAGLIAWLGAQVYDLQPARIKAAQGPLSVQITKP